jgi:hypothetical protein
MKRPSLSSPRSPLPLSRRRSLAGVSISLATMVAALGLGACGSTVQEPSGTGGSTTTGTSTGTGLTSGSGGSSTTGAGGSSTGQGGSTTTGAGGGSTTGAGGSITTTTGAGGGIPTCPAAEPMSQTACGPIGLVCDYDLTQCVCSNNGWRCNLCPEQQPEDGSACMSGGPGMGGGAVCGYGDTYCRCGGGGPAGSSWQCGMCPAEAPADNGPCDIQGVQCPYASAGITCNCTGMGTWNCTDPCPPAQPQPGEACAGGMGGPPQQCTYGGTTCICIQGQYFCN